MSALTTFWVGAVVVMATLQVPDLPIITDDPQIIAVIDVFRVLILMAGVILAAVIIHQMRTFPSRILSGALVPGYRTDRVALATGTAFMGVTIYDRLEEPVTIQFIIAIAFLCVAGMSVHRTATAPRPPIVNEENLRAFRPPSQGMS